MARLVMAQHASLPSGVADDEPAGLRGWLEGGWGWHWLEKLGHAAYATMQTNTRHQTISGLQGRPKRRDVSERP